MAVDPMQVASANNSLPTGGGFDIGGAMSGFNMFLSGLSQQESAKATAADARANAKIAGLNREKSNRNYTAAINEIKLNKKINLDTNYTTYMYGGLTMMGTPERVQKATTDVYNKDINLMTLNMRTDDQIYRTQQQSFYDAAAAAEDAGFFGKITSAIGGAVTGFAAGGPAGAFVGAGVGLFA